MVIRGTEVDADGKTRVIELSHFDAMLKVSGFYLAALNVQNKMWGLYTVPQAAKSDAPDTMTLLQVRFLHGASHVSNAGFCRLTCDTGDMDLKTE